MKKFTTIGRIIYALPFLFFGINHFVKVIHLYDPEFTSFIPLGAYTIMLTGVVMILASIGIMLNRFTKTLSMVLAVLLFLFITTIHIPHLIQGVSSEYALINLLKDLSLMGGSILIASMSFDK